MAGGIGVVLDFLDSLQGLEKKAETNNVFRIANARRSLSGLKTPFASTF